MPHASFDASPLIESEPFRRLLGLEKVASPFEVYGIESNELVHSRVLGALLAADGPLGFGATLVPRLAAALRMADSGAPLDSGRVAELSEARFRVRLEHPCRIHDGGTDDLGRMDILLEDEVRKIALVIENKIWAGEQDRQIERYRTWLAIERAGWRSMVVYLTPGGGSPSEWDKERTDLPRCALLGWRDVHQALSGLEGRDASGVVQAFRHNIRRHIMGDTTEKQLVREIMAKPELAAVVYTILDNLPKLEDIQSDLERGVRAITGMQEIEVKPWPPKRGDARELQVYLKTWKDAGIPICFNFYDGDLPAMRTMVHVDHWPAFEPVARILASYEDSAVDKNCRIRGDWRSWRLVMADDADTREAWTRTTISDRSFSPESARDLLAIFEERFLKLKPTIDRYLAGFAKPA